MTSDFSLSWSQFSQSSRVWLSVSPLDRVKPLRFVLTRLHGHGHCNGHRVQMQGYYHGPTDQIGYPILQLRDSGD